MRLPEEYLLRLIGELSGMGPLLELIARPDIEDIAINLRQIYVYTTAVGWQHWGEAPESSGDALRVMIDRAGQRAPTPDYPIADAMLQVMTPTPEGVKRKGMRINYIMSPASPYGDVITLRISNYRTAHDLEKGSLALLCQKRLPPVPRPAFGVRDFPRGNGVLTPEAANYGCLVRNHYGCVLGNHYLLAVMVRGGTLVIAGATSLRQDLCRPAHLVRSTYSAGNVGLLPAWRDPLVYHRGQQRDCPEWLERRPARRYGQYHLHRYPLGSARRAASGADVRLDPRRPAFPSAWRGGGRGAWFRGMGIDPRRRNRSWTLGFHHSRYQRRTRLAALLAGGAGAPGRAAHVRGADCPGFRRGSHGHRVHRAQFAVRPDGAGDCRGLTGSGTRRRQAGLFPALSLRSGARRTAAHRQPTDADGVHGSGFRLAGNDIRAE